MTERQQRVLEGIIANSPIYVTSIGNNGESVPASLASPTHTTSTYAPIPNGHPQQPEAVTTVAISTQRSPKAPHIPHEIKVNHIDAISIDSNKNENRIIVTTPSVHIAPVRPVASAVSNCALVAEGAGVEVTAVNSETVNSVCVVGSVGDACHSPLTNGRTEKLLGEQPENRRTSCAELFVGTDTR